MFSYPIDSRRILQRRKTLKNGLLGNGRARLKIRIAVLSGSVVNDIIDILELFLLHLGIEPTFYISEQGKFWEESMFPPKSLIIFKPDIIFIHTSFRNISNYPEITDSDETVEEKINIEFSKYFEMWENLKKLFKCNIIQNNFETPFYRVLGNKDASSPQGKINFINRLNLKFYNYANKNPKFYINDINYLSSFYGLERWSDPLYWITYQYTVALPLMPEFAHNLANIIKSIFGKNKKVLALNLDNTIWAVDGADKIHEGSEISIRQGYSDFQNYIRDLKDIGVILALCSKNNVSTDLNYKINHIDDFQIIKINSDPKDKNIADIAEELNIFPDSIVFMGDSPFDREVVKTQFPAIETPEISDVEHYIKILDRNGFFEVTEISEDDLKRTEMCRQNRLRSEYKKKFDNYSDYLCGLEMVAEIRPFIKENLHKITQLINKTNQFNLTAIRYQQFEVDDIAKSNNYISFTGRLSDKFGDNGIVTAIIGEIKDKSLHIDLWIMSYNAVKCDMQYALMDFLIEKSIELGIDEIYGYFHPTGNNHKIINIYSDFAFNLINAKPSGESIWLLDAELYKSKNKHIKIERINNDDKSNQ